MAVLYMAAGINHFVHPGMYLKIMPPWLPAHGLLIFLSGAFEILLGVLLIFEKTRRKAAWGIIFLLLLVLPANVQMAVNFRQENHPFLWLAILRLPMQALLIWWAFHYTGPLHQTNHN